MTIPPSIIIELTYRCNHRCSFCSCPWLRHDSLYGQEINAETWFRILDYLHAHGVRSIQFTGGEPVLKERFADILQHAAGLSFQELSCFSNGSLWDDDLLNLFQRCRVRLATSLPGYFSYRKLTSSPCSAGELLENVRRARQREMETSVSITVTAKNLWELPFAILMATFHRASGIQIQSCAPEGRALEHLDLIPSDRQFKRIFQWAKFFCNLLHIPVTFCYEQRCECYDLEGKSTGFVPETCTAGKEFMVISPDGRLRKCLHAPEAIGSIFDLMGESV